MGTGIQREEHEAVLAKNVRTFIKSNSIEFVFVTLLALILVSGLLIDPIVGKVNNGDFGRLFRLGGLMDVSSSYTDIYDGFVHKKYKVFYLLLLLPWGADWVFGAVVLKITVAINFIFYPFGVTLFDIRVQTFLYCVLFVSGVFCMLTYKKFSPVHKTVLGIFILAFFTDINYIAYFNSFYGEAATIVFFFLTIGTYLLLISKEVYNLKLLIAFFISSLGFLTSKAQQIPLLLFMLFIYGALYVACADKKLKKTVLKLSTFVIVFCSLVYVSIGDYTNKNNLYQAVFTGVLKGSSNPEGDLQELGLDPEFASLAGTGFYDKNLSYDPLGKEMADKFYPKASRSRILLYYLKHPARIFEKANNSASHAYDFYTLNESNFAKGEFTKDKFFNQFRVGLVNSFPSIHRNIYVFIGFSSIYFALCMFYFTRCKERDTRLLILLLLFILLCGFSQLFLPVLGSGEADFGKHLFLINLAYDTMAGVALLYVVSLAKNIVGILQGKKRHRTKTIDKTNIDLG